MFNELLLGMVLQGSSIVARSTAIIGQLVHNEAFLIVMALAEASLTTLLIFLTLLCRAELARVYLPAGTGLVSCFCRDAIYSDSASLCRAQPK